MAFRRTCWQLPYRYGSPVRASVPGTSVLISPSLLALMLVERPAEQIGLMMIAGVPINSFAATQDVAVDGNRS